MPLADEAMISRKPTLIAADVATESILLDVDSGYFFQLNATAAKVWHLVETPKPMSALYGELASAFDVDPATCRGDVEEFVSDMVGRGLLLVDAA